MKHSGFQHQALIYEGAEEYLAGTVPFLRGALEAGEPALVVVGREQTELLEDELGDDAGRVRFLPMDQVGRNPARIIPLWRDFLDANEGSSVRGIGEPVWVARSPAALEECQRHESLLNAAFASGPAWSLLCPYDAGSLPDEALEKVGHSHRQVLREGRGGGRTTLENDPDRFKGGVPPPAPPPPNPALWLCQLPEGGARGSG